MKGFFLLYVLLEHVFGWFTMDVETLGMMIGIVHHLPVIKGSLSIIRDPMFIMDKAFYSTQWSHILVAYSFAYFLYDVVFLTKYYWPPSKRLTYYVHAIACAITFGYIYEVKKYHYYAAAFLTWEASTPFLYLATYMTKKNMHNTMMYKVNAVVFAFLFFVFRVCFGSYVVYGHVWHIIPHSLKLVALTLTGLNYYWFYRICHKFKRTLQRA